MTKIPLPLSVWLDVANILQRLKAWAAAHTNAASMQVAGDAIYIDHRLVLEGKIGEWAFSSWFYGDERPFWIREQEIPPTGDGGSDLLTGELVNVKTTRAQVAERIPDLHLLIPRSECRRGWIHVFVVISPDRTEANLMGWTRSFDHLAEAMRYGSRGTVNARVPVSKLHSMDTLKACL